MKLQTLTLAALLAPAAGLAGQTVPVSTPGDGPPDAFADFERARSQACVGVLDRLATLNLELQPFGLRVERLRAIAEAIALEERAVMEELDTSDELEAAVRAWFVSDGQLANRFVETQEVSLQQQRRIAREGIKNRIQAEITSQQEQAQAILEAAGDLPEESQECDGAILIRSAVLEACADGTGAVCDAARSEEPQGIRFVESAADLWDVRELRPWTQPDRIQVAPTGQIVGGTTSAFARHGNIVITVSFAPLIRQRAELPPEDLTAFQSVLDTIGFEFDHPELIYAPALAIGATLPEPLAGEDMYVMHFGGEDDDLDVVWTAPAGTGAPVEGPALLGPTQLMKLQGGLPLRLTAISSNPDGETSDALYTLDVTTVNQAAATGQLLAYMAQQLEADLRALGGPGGTGAPR